MAPHNASLEVQAMFHELRRTAASDPRTARARLVEIIITNGPTLEQLLQLMDAPSEGRLRQLVANTARAQKGSKLIRDSLIPRLIRWQTFETDEFTKAAISAALHGIDLSAFAGLQGNTKKPSDDESTEESGLFSEEAIAIYRWVAGRLCHRVRNRLDLPVALLADAMHEVAAIEDPSIRIAITKRLVETKESFQRISRIVEFNIDDDHFLWRPVSVVPWLRRMTERFKPGNRSFKLEVTGVPDGPDLVIEATELLLELVFLNLWQNIAQETEGDCLARVEVSTSSGQLRMVISDNGHGFNEAHSVDAFSSSISTHGVERGRGLLEVADAVRRLRGTAQLVRVGSSYRIELAFPLAQAIGDSR